MKPLTFSLSWQRPGFFEHASGMNILRISVVFLETGVELLHSRFRAERLLAPLLEPTHNYQNVLGCTEALDVRRTISLALRATHSCFSCLHQSIAAARVLRRRGIPATVRIAPQSLSEGRFTAHAWVELADRSIIGGILTKQPIFARDIQKGATRENHDG